MKKYTKISIIGDFALGQIKAAGQQAKTLALARALRTYYSASEMRKIDTWNWRKHPFRLLRWVIYSVCHSRAVIMLPASKGVQVFAPLLGGLGKLLNRQLHYVVIGGWLPEMTRRKKWLKFFLKQFDGIYVETVSMKTALEKQGFRRVFVMPNFKNLTVLREEDLTYTTQEPFAFCTFSRVTKEKGVEDAIKAITHINTQAGRVVALLDIYGPVAEPYRERFSRLQDSFPPYITYKGTVAPNQSVDILKHYFALLFPTYYEGEGFAGTLLDALAAGVPAIATDWKYNKEIVQHGKTGKIIQDSLVAEIEKAISDFSAFNNMKLACLQEAQKYLPRTAIIPLIEKLHEIPAKEVNK